MAPRSLGASVRRAVVGAALAAGLTVAAAACKEPPPAPLVQQVEARGIAADLRVSFSKASDASNRAVMAETDEASTAFATEAEQSKSALRTGTGALAPLLERLDYSDESQMLKAFQKHFDDYDALDRKVLALAVENTNLKAQRLAFGPSREAASSFRAALESVSNGASPKTSCRVAALVSSAVLAVREIQVLYAPHIAESDEAAMASIEKEMSGLDAAARGALATLAEITEPGSRKALHDAMESLERFTTTRTQLIALSRRNSNVYSLQLALGEGRALSSACDADLRALADAIGRREISRATR